MGGHALFDARFLGYDATGGVFLLTIDSATSDSVTGAKSAALRREIGDFQALDRAVHRVCKSGNASIATVRLSLRRLKKLTESSWLREHAAGGWRPELQKNVLFCEQWLQSTLAVAPSDDRIKFMDEHAYQAHHRARAATQRAKRLQQYFTSESVTQFVLQRLQRVLQHEDNAMAIGPLDADHVVWLEPSCGDARLVRALVDAGATRVLGYELDEHVYAKALESTKELRGVSLTRGDFLTTSRPSFLEPTTTVLALGNPPFGSEIMAENKNPDDDPQSGHRQDLVNQFILHLALVWKVQLLAVIVPVRCARPEYVARVLSQLNERVSDQAATLWRVALCELLSDCTFEFQETKQVKQPSAFIVFVVHTPPQPRATSA